MVVRAARRAGEDERIGRRFSGRGVWGWERMLYVVSC